MRIVMVIVTFLALSIVSPALAAPGKSPPGQDNKPEKTEQSGKPEKPEKPDKVEKPDTSVPGSGSPNQAHSATPAGEPGSLSRLDQDEALQAVEQRKALPLARIVVIAEGRPAGGNVVNARLVRVRDVLLYQLTMLDETGRSWRDYYYARSGFPVESN